MRAGVVIAVSQADFLNLFVRSPGDLLYFLVVIAVSQASLFMALGHRFRRPGDPLAHRYTLATLGLVISWVLLMAGALFTLLSRQNSGMILPPLERVVSMMTLLLLAWAFLTPQQGQGRRLSNILVLVLMAAAIVGYIVTGAQWSNDVVGSGFNTSVYALYWTQTSAALAAACIGLTLFNFRRISDAPLKLVFFVIMLLGFVGAWIQLQSGGVTGDYLGATRLAFLAALPFLPTLLYRMVVGGLEAAADRAESAPAEVRAQVSAPSQLPEPTPSPVERQSVQLLRALGIILENSTPANIPQQVVIAALDVLKADVGAILKLQDANYADVVAGYDKAMSRQITGMALNLDHQPTLVNAIERLAQRPLYVDRNIEELEDFYTRLDVSQKGPVYFQPLIHDQSLIAVLAVGFPYTRREMTDPEAELLKGIGVISSGLLALSFAAGEARLMAEERAIQAMVQGVTPDALDDSSAIAARQEMQANLDLARDQIAQLNRQITELKIQLDDERTRVVNALGDTQQGLSISQRIRSIQEEQQRLREERDTLLDRLQEYETMLAGATAADTKEVVQKLTERLRIEKHELEAERARLQAQLDEMRANDRILLPQEIQALVGKMTQEKIRLEAERDTLSHKLADVQAQLRSLGVEGGISGLTQLVAQLYEQIATLQSQSAALKRERDILLHERTRFEAQIQKEAERESRIHTLQVEIMQLAADREALTAQRDKLRAERDELLARQEATKQHRARLLSQVAGYELELQEVHQEQIDLRTRLQEALDEISDLLSHQDHLMAEKQAVENERDQLLARIEGDRDRLQQLGADGVGALTKMIEELSDQRNKLERELNHARTRLAALEKQMETAKGRSNGDPQAPVYKAESPELLMGLVQELRTPMTSISGYIDLLLSESAGILGEMQHKFLQRVAANVTRLAAMLDDLINLTAIDTGRFTLEPENIDVLSVIEDTITNLSSQIKERELSINLSFEDDLPELPADKDAIGQVVTQLLSNAYLVSPPRSEISVTARRLPINLSRNGHVNGLTDSLYIAIEDRGGGIADEDHPRVFARKYKAENPLIEGLGDTGVGLSIAKALVEAHGGKLWLETRPGIGSIFSFALPLHPALEAEG